MKLIRTFSNAWRGIVFCYRTQLNFRFHLAATISVAVAGFILKITTTEWVFIIACCVLVVATEMLNTAIEKLCDLVTLDFHPAIKNIKDISAGAVLVCAAGSAITGVIIFFPKIYIQIKLLLQ